MENSNLNKAKFSKLSEPDLTKTSGGGWMPVNFAVPLKLYEHTSSFVRSFIAGLTGQADPE